MSTAKGHLRTKKRQKKKCYYFVLLLSQPFQVKNLLNEWGEICVKAKDKGSSI